MRYLLSILALCAVSAPATAAPAGSPAAAPAMPASVRAVVNQFCVDCHGPQKQKAQLRFDQIAGFRADDRNLWANVHEQVASRDMPPADRPQPTDAQRQLLLGWIEQQSQTLRQSQGASGTRRLNRRELSGALQDLTGLPIDYTGSLPGDGKVAGFDTGADGLQDAADSVAVAMNVSRRAVDAIRFLEPSPGVVVRGEFRVRDPKKALDAWKTQGVTSKGRNGVPDRGLVLEPRWVGERDAWNITLQPPPRGGGVLRVRLVVSAIKPIEGLPNPRLWVEIGGREFDFHELKQVGQPVELSYIVQIEDLAVDARGLVISLSNRVEVPYAVPGYENEDTARPGEEVPGGTGLYRPRFDRKLPPEKQPAPTIFVEAMEIEMDYVAAWPPPSWGATGTAALADNDVTARWLLKLWTERAWRKPVADADLNPFFALYAGLRKQGQGFDAALRPAFQAVLMSGPFRYLAAASKNDPHAIASRLSFTLWGAPPDAELRGLADSGKLKDPAVFDAQVDRLLKDPRSDGFFRPFVTQWLEMDQPITLVMDNIKKQDFRFGRHLKASMREETIQYIAALVRENRPAHELIQSDWTLMNDILARHYGYPAMPDGTLRKVTLRKDDPRGGGVLGHAGIQSMLTWMGENWVIYRGAWAMRHILDDPPPPPPLEVPELIPSEGKNKGKSFRQLLVQHQQDVNCSICHTKMDPVGFAFQNFDISGRWRNEEHESYARAELDGKIEWRGTGKSRPVDAIGQLPRGEKFATFGDFKTLAATHYRGDVVRGILRNMTVYSAGRSPDVTDMQTIKSILKEQEPRGYPLGDVTRALLRSRVFQGD